MDNDRDRFHEEVQEALELLEFAVSQGFTSEDGRKVDDGLIEAINRAEDMAHSEEPPPAERYHGGWRYLSAGPAQPLSGRSNRRGKEALSESDREAQGPVLTPRPFARGRSVGDGLANIPEM